MKSKQRSRAFRGALLDTGAQRTVIDENQARQYCSSNHIPFELLHSHSKFKFASLVRRALVRMKILIPTPGGTIRLCVYVVTEDVTLLVGLEVMERHHLQFLSVSNQLECVTENWRMPVTRHSGHAYLKWEPILSALYTRSELIRLHKHLLHPSVRKLYNLLRRASPEDLPSDIRRMLQEIS